MSLPVNLLLIILGIHRNVLLQIPLTISPKNLYVLFGEFLQKLLPSYLGTTRVILPGGSPKSLPRISRRVIQ